MRLLLIFFLIPILGFSDSLFLRDPCNTLLYDLQIATYFDQKLECRFPETFNHILSTGYFTTPSARMTEEGLLSLGYARAPPYSNWNGRFQLFRFIELSVNYRIFEGVEDINLTKFGFGNYADRGANIKWALINPEDSYYDLPGFAIGVEDFMGSKKFTNYFAVLTKVWPSYGLETTIGFGSGRYSDGPSCGFFGGFSLFPWWECNHYFKNLGLAVEYDPINYKNPKKEPNPHGRNTNMPVNFGLKYKFKNFIDLSFSYIRGAAFAFAGNINCPLGLTEGFLTKLKDPPFYSSPCKWENCSRDESELVQEMAVIFDNQGFTLTKSWTLENILWLSLINENYRTEECVRKRIESVLAALTPANISCIVVILETYGMPSQQYIYPRELLLDYFNCHICDYEFSMLVPRKDFSGIPCEADLIYYDRLDPWRFRLSPRFESFFGNAKGKFKYDLGLRACVDGFLPYDIYYELECSYTFFSTINDVSDFDMFSPSQLPNVLTDYVNYRKQKTFSADRAYVQKNWNLSHGWFSKVALGYFQVNYAGVDGELLWYPVDRFYGFGVEGALLRKRKYKGLAFQSKLRKFNGFTPEFIPYSLLSQYFLNFYFDIPEFCVAGKVGAGGFLAYDKGFRLEVTRYFDSGLRVTGWMTFTNAGDKIHNENFYNRGIAIELPLDLFFRCSSRRVWNYGMAAWLRDAGASIPIGKSLFDIINRERRP